jgi:hypothetical protein
LTADASLIVAAIDQAYAKPRDEAPREYIGASSVGNECDAFLELSLRGAPEDPPPPHVQRIFKLGHLIEDLVIADLRKAGLDVSERDHMTGRQFSFRELGGHVRANADGLMFFSNETGLLEVKSMNDDRWSDFKERGVFRSHRHYWDQMMLLMALSGIRWTLFIAYNKNDSRYWAEIVTIDAMHASFLEQRIERVFAGEARKISADPTDWRCAGCFKKTACWEAKGYAPSCRNCAHAAPSTSGEWTCLKTNSKATKCCSLYETFVPKPRR